MTNLLSSNEYLNSPLGNLSESSISQSFSHSPSALPQNTGQLALNLSWDKIGESTSKIVWDKKDWLPRGYVTLLAGESGIGKSHVLLRIAGCYTDGWCWIDGSPFDGPQGWVVWCEGEAAQLLNLNRAVDIGITTRKMLSLFENPFIDFNVEDENHKGRLTDLAYHKGVSLIIVDSLSGIHLGDENSTEMNRTIKFFAELARNSGKPILISHHLKKKNLLEKGNITLDRIRGSSSIVQNARMIWAVDQPDPNKDQKRLQVIKSNLGIFPEPSGFQITSKGIEYQPLDEKKNLTQLDKAKEFLLRVLSSGPVLSSDVEELAEQNNIANRTLLTAKKDLKVESIKIKEANGSWFWSLSDKEEFIEGNESSQPSQPSQLDCS